MPTLFLEAIAHAVGKHAIYPLGKTTVQVNMHGVDTKLVDCFVLDHLGPPVDLLIGSDSMELHGLSLEWTCKADLSLDSGATNRAGQSTYQSRTSPQKCWRFQHLSSMLPQNITTAWFSSTVFVRSPSLHSTASRTQLTSPIW